MSHLWDNYTIEFTQICVTKELSPHELRIADLYLVHFHFQILINIQDVC